MALIDFEMLPATVRRVLADGPVMLVDPQAICRNFARLAAMTTGRCAAVVKGDGYGHGMHEASRALHAEGARLFFTARFDDALALRASLGPDAEIAVLDGLTRASLAEAMARSITPVVNSAAQLHDLAEMAREMGSRLPAYLHIDTAMNRLGLGTAELSAAREALVRLTIRAYMTHFASADDLDLDLCALQVSRLNEACRTLPPAPLSIANSSGTFLGSDFHGDLIRPGKSTFGIHPLLTGSNPMEQPATVLAPVVQLRHLRRGAPVGYSCTWRAPAPTRIAVIAIGYANGYHRANSNVGAVAFGGRLCPVVGRVSMDLTAVDISALPEGAVTEMSLAEIVGPTVSYRMLAQQAGTNEHEAIIALGRGCRRLYLDSPVLAMTG